MTEKHTGILLHGSTPPADLIDLCRFVEDNNFSELWLSEDYFMLAGFSSVAIALQATRKIDVGLGIVSSVVRHPAVTAMEISTVAGAFPGRLHMGIGHGVPAWTKQMGLFPKSMLQAAKETVTSIRRLLDGETLSESGHFHFDGVRLEHPVANVPVYMGVTGPKSLALSGEIADGTILSALAGPKYVEWARQTTGKAALAAGVDRDHKLPTYVLFSISRNRNEARAIARAAAAFYLFAMGPTALTDAYSINDTLADMTDRGGAELVQKEMPEEWLDWLTICGEPDECAERINALYHAGSTSVILAPIPAETLRQQIELTAKEVLTRL